MDKGGNTAPSTSPPSSSLHAVRKLPAKPWKKPTVPPPSPPKVYRVDPRGFRLLVQRLTGATELPPRRLLPDAAPAQLDLVPRQGAPLPPPPPLQRPAASAQLYGHGGFSSSSSTLEYGHGYPMDEVTAPWETPQSTKVEAGDQAQTNTASVPSPTLYSEYSAWCNQMPLLSPGSMECLERRPGL